jgi:hypothetical protein
MIALLYQMITSQMMKKRNKEFAMLVATLKMEESTTL